MNKIILILISTWITISTDVFGQDRMSMIKPDKGILGPEVFFSKGNFGFTFFIDTLTFDSYLQFWRRFNDDWTHIIIDTVGDLYGSELYVYTSKNNNDYIILCESPNEYYSDIKIYFYNGTDISNIGPLRIQDDCSTCEDLSYPIAKINIYDNSKELIIKLLTPFLYDIGENDWQKFSHKDNYFTIDKNTKKLTKH